MTAYTRAELALITAWTLREAADYVLRGSQTGGFINPDELPDLPPDVETEHDALYDEQNRAFRAAEEAVLEEWRTRGVDWRATGATHPDGWAWRQAQEIGAINADTTVSVQEARELLAQLTVKES